MAHNYRGKLAAETYSTPEALPRSKYEFTVYLQHLDATGKAYTFFKMGRISEVTMPGHTFQTATLNQYNIKRTVNVGSQLNPVTVTAYDTRDARKPEAIETFLKTYANYYYGGVMTSDGKAEQGYDSLITDYFPGGESNRGYILPATNKYFINKLIIVRQDRGHDKNTITLYNPMITSVGGDNLNYSESGPVSYRIDFNYESYDITSTPPSLPKLGPVDSPTEV